MARARLQKVLASAGVASRRAAEELLRAGRVQVNGRPAGLGDRADPERDWIEVDGVRVVAEPLEYWLVHKPAGVLSTVRDPERRRIVTELVDSSRRLFPVGRLDRDTEGLLLLTNDGPLAHAMLHPSHGVEREYRVTVRGRIGRRELQRLAAGVELADGRTAPARVGPARYDAATERSRFDLTLTEGRKRQIRRALAALRHPVLRLLRVRMGPLRLGRLGPGEARPASAEERRALAALRRELGRAAADASSREGS